MAVCSIFFKALEKTRPSMAMVDLPNTMIEIPVTMVDLPDTMVHLHDYKVYICDTMVDMGLSEDGKREVIRHDNIL